LALFPFKIGFFPFKIALFPFKIAFSRVKPHFWAKTALFAKNAKFDPRGDLTQKVLALPKNRDRREY
jgi:hypothetical protein